MLHVWTADHLDITSAAPGRRSAWTSWTRSAPLPGVDRPVRPGGLTGTGGTEDYRRRWSRRPSSWSRTTTRSPSSWRSTSARPGSPSPGRATGTAGSALAAEHAPALVVVDIGLPGGIDGLEVCRRLRAESDVPVLVLTARGDEADRVPGFELGRRRLRHQAVLAPGAGGPGRGHPPPQPGRRAPAAPCAVGGDVEVDLARHEARRAGEVVPLAPREFALLAALVEHRGQVLSRRQLLDLAWGYDLPATSGRSTSTSASCAASSATGSRSPPLRGAGYRLG